MIRPLAYLLAAAAVFLAAGRATAQSDTYLSDARTARAVAFSFPRGPLSECVSLLARGSGVSLAAAPSMRAEPLVAYVPKRPLRETMRALEELFDGTWAASAGAAPSYVLKPDAAREKANAWARTATLRQYRKGLDEQSAEAVRDAKKGVGVPDSELGSRLVLVLWSYLKPAERTRVLEGVPLTITIPENNSLLAYEAGIAAARRGIATLELKRLAGPLIASFDLDDGRMSGGADNALPFLRGRVTALRENSAVGAIGTVEYAKVPPAPKTPAAAGAPSGPAISPSAKLYGTRDDLVFKIGQACGVPVLSRHRAYGGSMNIDAAGQTLPQIVAEFASGSDCRLVGNARGYELLRSLTEAYDYVGAPGPAVVQRYLQQRPKVGETVDLEQLGELSLLSPLQLAVLQRSNVCTGDCTFVRDGQAIVRFYRLLTPDQRKELFSAGGLAVRALNHPQLHALLDQKTRRGNWDIHEQMQGLTGLRLRFSETKMRGERSISFYTVRDGKQATTENMDLPRVEEEDRPALIP